MENKLKDFLNRDDCFFIHYASDGFYNGSSPAPRISSIMIYNAKNDLDYRFSIGDYTKNNSTEDAEKLALQNFKLLFKKYPDICFIHWNMGSDGFGFKALRERAAELDIIIPVISEDNLFDLSSYVSFISGKNLSIKQALWFNSLLYGNDFLSGKEEAEYFKKWKYDEISKSLELKVKGFSEMVKLIEKGKFKTEPPYQNNDGLTKEERHQAALQREKMREQIMNDIMEHNKKILKRKEEAFEEFIKNFESKINGENSTYPNPKHPFLSLFASWVGSR